MEIRLHNHGILDNWKAVSWVNQLALFCRYCKDLVQEKSSWYEAKQPDDPDYRPAGSCATPDIYQFLLGGQIIIWETEQLDLARSGASAAFNQTILEFPIRNQAMVQLWLTRDLVLADRNSLGLDVDCQLAGIGYFEFPCDVDPTYNEYRKKKGWPLKGPTIGGAVFICYPLFSDTAERKAEDVCPRLRWINIGQSGSTCPEYACEIIAMSKFLDSSVAFCEESRWPRSIRRSADRERKPLRRVNIIRLRRSLGDNSKNRQTVPITWSCQWIVSGHWRKQWYPSKADHKPVYISPYLKGPEERPIKIPNKSIFVVNR